MLTEPKGIALRRPGVFAGSFNLPGGAGDVSPPPHRLVTLFRPTSPPLRPIIPPRPCYSAATTCVDPVIVTGGVTGELAAMLAA